MASTINAKNTSTGVVITPDASGQLELQTVDTTRMTITSGGDVGIGTTSPTAYGTGYTTLDINGSTQGTIQCEVGGTPQALIYANSTEGGTGTLTNIPFRFVTNNSERMRIDSSGNVGIGTASPTQLLDVTTGSGGSIAITAKTSTSSQILNIGLDPTNGAYFGTYTNQGLRLITNSSERMRIDSSGNVGIGTTSPSANLEIFGASTPYQLIGNGTQRSFLGVDGGGGFTGTLSNHSFFLRTNNTNQVGVTSAGLFQFNSGYGSVATAYGCRAWVNFNGTGTVAIRASGNVSSITDNGVGIYTINFTNAMPDVNYAVCSSGRYQTAGGSDDAPIVGVTGANFSTPTTSAVQIGVTTDTAAGVDPNAVYVSVFR